MAIRTEVRERFEKDPEDAFRWVERGLSGRQRRIVLLLWGLLEEIDGLIAVDPDRAHHLAERAFAVSHGGTDSPAVMGMAYGVLASSYIAVKREREALRLLKRGRELKGILPDVRGSLLAREAVALRELRRWDEARWKSERSVKSYESIAKSSVVSWSDFNSLPMALIVRARVWVDMFQHCPEQDVGLEQVVADSSRALSLSHKLRLRRIPFLAIGNLGVVIAARGFSEEGLTLKEARAIRGLVQTARRGFASSSCQWAMSRWLEGLLEAQVSRVLTPAAERAFRSGRDVLVALGRIDEAVELTLDLQWWLIESGSPGRAVIECRWLESRLDEMRYDHDVVRRWIVDVRRGHLEAAALSAVFREVRGVRGVRAPGAIHGKTAAADPYGW